MTAVCVRESQQYVPEDVSIRISDGANQFSVGISLYNICLNHTLGIYLCTHPYPFDAILPSTGERTTR